MQGTKTILALLLNLLKLFRKKLSLDLRKTIKYYKNQDLHQSHRTRANKSPTL